MEKNYEIRDIVLTGLLIAIVYVATAIIKIPGVSEGGLFHMGNVAHFTIAMIFGKKKGAISGAVGMALFDITSEYAVWAPATFIIRFLIGYSIGYIANINESRGKNLALNIASLIPATIIMIGGYYLAEGIMYGNWVAPMVSVWPNTMQCIVGAAAVVFAPILSKTFKRNKILV